MTNKHHVKDLSVTLLNKCSCSICAELLLIQTRQPVEPNMNGQIGRRKTETSHKANFFSFFFVKQYLFVYMRTKSNLFNTDARHPFLSVMCGYL